MWECRKWRNVHRFDIFSMRSSPQFLNRTNYFGFCRCSGFDPFPMPSNGDFGFVMQKVFLVSFVGLLDFSHGTTNYGIRLPSKWLEKLNRFWTAKNFMDAYTKGTEIVLCMSCLHFRFQPCWLYEMVHVIRSMCSISDCISVLWSLLLHIHFLSYSSPLRRFQIVKQYLSTVALYKVSVFFFYSIRRWPRLQLYECVCVVHLTDFKYAIVSHPLTCGSFSCNEIKHLFVRTWK